MGVESAKLISVAISLGIGSLAIALRYRVTYAWSHPSVIFASFWFVMTLLPLIFVWNIPVEPLAVAYLAGITIAFCAPSLFVNWRKVLPTVHEPKDGLPIFLLTIVFYSIQTIAVASIFENLHRNGFSIGAYFLDPLGASTAYLNASSEGAIRSSLFSSVGFVLIYAASAIGGLIFAGQKSRIAKGILFATVFFPPLMHVWLYSLKGTLFLTAALFFGGVLAGRVSRGDLSLINRATIRFMLGLSFPIFALMYFAMLARPGRGMWGADEQGAKVLYYLSSYSFGHLYAFSDWFSSYFLSSGHLSYTNPNTQTWGYWTFMAIGKIVNPSYELPAGYYSEYFGPNKVLQSNIYTAFRGMIYDFNLVGSLAFMAAMGAVVSHAYFRMLTTKKALVSQVVFIFSLGWIYQSYIFSMFAWPTAICAAILAAVILLGCSFASSYGRSTS